jgi:hypothetical protein
MNFLFRHFVFLFFLASNIGGETHSRQSHVVHFRENKGKMASGLEELVLSLHEIGAVKVCHDLPVDTRVK